MRLLGNNKQQIICSISIRECFATLKWRLWFYDEPEVANLNNRIQINRRVTRSEWCAMYATVAENGLKLDELRMT